jgi:hypothetical protein
MKPDGYFRIAAVARGAEAVGNPHYFKGFKTLGVGQPRWTTDFHNSMIFSAHEKDDLAKCVQKIIDYIGPKAADMFTFVIINFEPSDPWKLEVPN